MTFQPPPPGDNPPAPPPSQPGPYGPPSGGPPPPQPGPYGPPSGGQPAQYAAPSGGHPASNAANVNPLDWGIVGAGLLAFIFSFVSYYTYSVHIAGFSASGDENAWHGFFGWFAMLLAVAGAVVVAMELFSPQVKFPWPNRLVGLAAFGLALIFVILAGLIDARSVPSGISSGRGAGYWLSLIVILAGTVLSFMRAQQTGTKLPGPLSNIPQIGPKNS